VRDALMKAAATLALFVGVALSRRRQGTDPLTSTGVSPLAESILRTVLKHPWLTLGALGAFAATAGLIVVASGIVPIKASSGHWRITAAILDFAKVRSVKMHSMGIRPPFPLDDPALVLRGAGHYESGCYPCHGKPGVAVPPVMAAMTPPPPDLSPRIRRWRPQDLFSIVKHGIKFTGMPAWPVQQRDDEVWAVVAFLRRLPSLDATAYRELVYGAADATNTATPRTASLEPQERHDDQTPRIVRDVCRRCHGPDGTGRGSGAFPSLAGQRSAYMHAALRAFADRRRFSGIMGTLAANLDEQSMREAAAYYARLPARSSGAANDVAARARGESIATQGVPDRDIPSCADCHGPAETPKNAAYPILAGQHARYLALQLELFQQRRRGGSGFANLMHVFVGRLRPHEIKDVTSYYASLRASGFE
jgi:cytochrome c553